MNLVSLGQLYGGKICAALDRQHPRDLFDVKLLIENEGFSDEIKRGFLFALLSSRRPIQEILFPHFIDQSQTFANQFEGMTTQSFTYKDFENIRIEILKVIHSHLTKKDRHFIIQFAKVQPDWSAYDFQNYPSVQWELQNLGELEQINPKKHLEEVSFLEEKLM